MRESFLYINVLYIYLVGRRQNMELYPYEQSTTPVTLSTISKMLKIRCNQPSSSFVKQRKIKFCNDAVVRISCLAVESFVIDQMTQISSKCRDWKCDVNKAMWWYRLSSSQHLFDSWRISWTLHCLKSRPQPCQTDLQLWWVWMVFHF